MEIGKIIEALTICGGDIGCVKCPYEGHGCTETMMKDAVTQLKAAKEIIEIDAQKPKARKYQLKEKGRRGKSANVVLMLDEDGNILKRFESARDAGEFIKKDHSQIRRCCRGEAYSCGGYRWMYEDI